LLKIKQAYDDYLNKSAETSIVETELKDKAKKLEIDSHK
jgi:hypothetical protein